MTSYTNPSSIPKHHHFTLNSIQLHNPSFPCFNRMYYYHLNSLKINHIIQDHHYKTEQVIALLSPSLKINSHFPHPHFHFFHYPIHMHHSSILNPSHSVPFTFTQAKLFTYYVSLLWQNKPKAKIWKVIIANPSQTPVPTENWTLKYQREINLLTSTFEPLKHTNFTK